MSDGTQGLSSEAVYSVQISISTTLPKEIKDYLTASSYQNSIYIGDVRQFIALYYTELENLQHRWPVSGRWEGSAKELGDDISVRAMLFEDLDGGCFELDHGETEA